MNKIKINQNMIKTNTTVRIVVFLVISSIYQGCGLFEPNTEIKLKGVITDARDQSPIRNAKVSLSEMGWSRNSLLKEVRTNSQGVYELTYEEDGENCPSYSLSVIADGYKEISCSSISIMGSKPCVRCKEGTQTNNFELERNEN